MEKCCWPARSKYTTGNKSHSHVHILHMYYITFIKGLLIGFSIAAPVGAIGILCIRRTLVDGRLSGFITGLGAATADAFYGAIAGFGLVFLSTFLIDQQLWIRLIGGLFLLFLGSKIFLTQPVLRTNQVSHPNLIGAYLTTLVLTLTNPLTILSFTAVFAGLGLGRMGSDYMAALALVAGVFLGSTLWWMILSGMVSLFRSRFGEDSLRWVNRLSGAVIFGFGLAAIATIL